MPAWRCFSLQLVDRTMDFAAPTDQEAVAWTIAFRTLCYSQGVWESGKRLQMGDVLWERSALKFDAAMWARKGKERCGTTADGTPAMRLSRNEMEALGVAVAQAKLRRLYDALEKGLAAAAEERQRLGYTRVRFRWLFG